MAEARSRNRAKYHDLVKAGRAAGYKTDLITVVVGSHGMLGESLFEHLKEAIHATRKDITSLCLQSIHLARVPLNLVL